MKYHTRLDRILQKYRGPGLLCLCLAMVVLGNRHFGGRAMQASSDAGGGRALISSVDTQKKQMALTFETVHGNTYTEKILDTLRDSGARATFFVTGDWVEAYPQEAKRMQAEGYELGNHGLHYEAMGALTAKECEKALTEAQEKIGETTGAQTRLFRAPYGEYSRRLIKTVKACGYDTIGWSVDSKDWKDYGANRILKDILKNEALEKGAILLLHSEAKYTAQMLKSLIDELQEEGYELVTVSELLGRE